MDSNNQDFEHSYTSTFTSFSLPRYIPSTSFLVFRRTLANKINHLFEITTILNEQKIFEIDLCFVNPYYAFVKKLVSAIITIKILSKQLVHIVKEYVQAFGFDQYPIPSTSYE